MKMEFVKMHGLGNDFVILNNLSQGLDLKKLSISRIADRHLGVGFDQLLVIEPSQTADLSCRIFNADGSEAAQCGNGLRCVARYAKDKGLVSKFAFTIATLAGIFPVHVKETEVEILLSTPQVTHETFSLSIANDALIMAIINVGNNHAIIQSTDLSHIDVAKMGAEIANHPQFLDGINVGFMEVLGPDRIHLRTYERGCGETNACGSNAAAAVALGIHSCRLNKKVRVKFKYGELQVHWPSLNSPIQLIGDANYVFSGMVEV